MKKSKEVRTVWIVQGFDQEDECIFMMVCASKEYAEKIRNEGRDIKGMRYSYFEIEDWAVCGH